MDCSPPGSSVPGISQVRILEWVTVSFSRGSSWPRDWTHVSCTGRQILCRWATREVQKSPVETWLIAASGIGGVPSASQMQNMRQPSCLLAACPRYTILLPYVKEQLFFHELRLCCLSPLNPAPSPGKWHCILASKFSKWVRSALSFLCWFLNCDSWVQTVLTTSLSNHSLVWF